MWIDAAWSPDGSEIVFTRYTTVRIHGKPKSSGDLYVINADGSGLRPLVRGPASTYEADWQPATTGP
jgi:Tol biopolymer transport system component